jgi:hypothetical protein
MIFNWTLNKDEAQESIFLKKKMREHAKIQKILGFIDGEMGITYQANERYKGIPDDTELQQLRRYKELYNRTDNFFNTAYNLSKHKWGRVIPANNYLSLSIFHRPTRHGLCDGIYIDIDMVNAHPTFLNEICLMNGITNDILIKYVNDPKQYREIIMQHHNCNKDTAKKLPLSLMNGGTYKGWIKENLIETNDKKFIEEIVKLEGEMRAVMEIIFTNNQKIKKDALKQDPAKWSTGDQEAKRGVMGLWCQTIEKMIQETAIKYLVDSKNFKLEDIVPCQDGFMILPQLWYDNIISDIELVIKNKYNINIKFIQKLFDEKIEIPEKELGKSYNEWYDELSCKRLADKYLEEFNDYIIKYKNNIYVYYENRWYDETDKQKQYKITIYISEKLYNVIKNNIIKDISLTTEEKESLLKILRSNTCTISKMNDMIKHIISKARTTETDFNNNPFLLGFENGVFDLLNGIFRDYRFDDYITMSTNYNYNKPDYSIETNQKLKEELISILETIQPDPECRKLYLQSLASGLDGRPYQKLFLFNGQGGNGKGLTGSLMDTILGSYYHQPSNGILKDVEKPNTPSPDMINLKNKRYINFKEVAGEIRVAVLRNLTGGGKFTGRFLNQNPETFFMSATFVMEFNTSPEFDGKPQRADYRRLLDLNFPINFTDDKSKIDKTIGGILYKQSNTYYETPEFLESIKYIFLDHLLDIYKESLNGVAGIEFLIPESIRKRTEIFIENQNLFQKIFNELWQKVDVNLNNKADIKDKTVSLKEIWTTIINNIEYKALSSRDKRQYGRDDFYKWIETIYTISGNTKTGKLIIGVERNFNDCDEQASINNIGNQRNPVDAGVFDD